MPRFTDAKRDRVRETLHETGRELFGRYELRRTTIEELMEPEAIASGTFYRFYDSKEDRYIDLVEEYSEELVPRVLGASFEAHDDPEETIAHAIRAVGHIVLHAEDLGEDRYPAVRATLIAAVAAGLTNGAEPTEGHHE